MAFLNAKRQNRAVPDPSKTDYPNFRNHYLPRSSTGRWALALFIFLFALVEPPIVYLFANRIEPTLFGLPFLYLYLSLIYGALIALLIWILSRRL